jgi:hypothetical protein
MQRGWRGGNHLELIGSLHKLRFHVQVRLPVLQERALLLPAEVCGLQQLQNSRPQAREAVVSAEKLAATRSVKHSLLRANW